VTALQSPESVCTDMGFGLTSTPAPVCDAQRLCSCSMLLAKCYAFLPL